VLLRALDSGIVCPVGGNQLKECDTRIVAATNRNLAHEIDIGGFREDLFYRLAVIQIELPPLRKRVEDIPLLVEHFLNELDSKVDKRTMQVGFQTMEKLKQYPWSGNVRELKNFVERAAILSDGERVETRFLRLNSQTGEGENSQDPFLGALQIPEEMAFKEAKNRLISAFETAYWQRLLKQTSGNVSEAARIAGVHRKSVEYILRKIGMSRSGESDT
jgi:DNA-binding NtrC family response regulator